MPVYFEQEAYLFPENTTAEDFAGTPNVLGSMLGYAVAISGDGLTIAVGSPYFDGVSSGDYQGPGIAPGAVFVWVLDGGVWTFQEEIHAADPVGGLTLFGAAVALSDDGDVLVVGSPLDGADSVDDYLAGSAFVFHRTGASWSQLGPRLAALDPFGGFSRFGASVDVWRDGTRVIVGDTYDGYTPVATLAHPDPDPAAGFGACTVYALSGDFETGSWVPVQVLKPVDASASMLPNVFPPSFGASITFAGSADRFVIGGPRDNTRDCGGPGSFGTQVGSIWVATNVDDLWTLSAAMHPPGGVDGCGGLAFGSTLDADGDWLVACGKTAVSPSVWVYEWVEGDLLFRTELDPEISNSFGHNSFPCAVSVSRDPVVIVLGAGPMWTEGGGSAPVGGAVAYELTGGSWAGYSVPLPFEAELHTVFGSSVAVSADAERLALGGSWQAKRTGAGWPYARSAFSPSPPGVGVDLSRIRYRAAQ